MRRKQKNIKYVAFLSSNSRLKTSKRTGKINTISSLNPGLSRSISSSDTFAFQAHEYFLPLSPFFTSEYFHYN